MNNYRLVVSYDGTRYKGWQRLSDEDMTIQGKIEDVLSKFLGTEMKIVGSSRTDAGVHAHRQIANFTTEEDKTVDEVAHYLNTYLPEDIRIKKVDKVDENFHARFNAVEKEYVYKIYNTRVMDPFQRKYAMHIIKELEVDSMRYAADEFLGEHDFTSFTNAKSKKKSMVREIKSIDIKENGPLIEIKIIGNGFLHNMVRKIVGTLIEVGQGKKLPVDVPKIFEAKDSKMAGVTAQAQGLFLNKIKF